MSGENQTQTRVLQPRRLGLRSGGLEMALVHEWLAERAGSEILFEQMAEVFGDADLYALTRSPGARFDFGGRSVRTTWLNASELSRSRRNLTLPLMPMAWKALRRRAYEVVLTSTHGFGREFVRNSDGVHLNYVHAPMRYAWSPELDGRAAHLGFLGRWAMAGLRKVDLRSVCNVDAFAANSTAVAERIENYYGRDATVIFPPVDVEFFSQVQSRDDGYLLSASRFIPYKRHDLAIKVAALLDLPLVVAGSGPAEHRLRDLADRVHPNGVTFRIQPTRVELRGLMAGASAFVFPAHEDFGIIVPEVQATGTAVVALAKGGTLDTIVDGKTGVLSPEHTIEGFVEATETALRSSIMSDACCLNAQRFTTSAFRDSLESWVERNTNNVETRLRPGSGRRVT